MNRDRARRDPSSCAASTQPVAIASSSTVSINYKRKYENNPALSDINLDDDVALTTPATAANKADRNIESANSSSSSHQSKYPLRPSTRTVLPLIHNCLFCPYSTKIHSYYVRHVSRCIDRTDVKRRRIHELSQQDSEQSAADPEHETDDAEDRTAVGTISKTTSKRSVVATSFHFSSSSSKFSSSAASSPTLHSDGEWHCSLCPVTTGRSDHMRAHFDACKSRTEPQRAERAKMLQRRKEVSAGSPATSSSANGRKHDSDGKRISQRLDGKKSMWTGIIYSPAAVSSRSTSASDAKKQKSSSSRSKRAADIDLSTGVVHTRSFPLSANQLMASVGYVLNPDELTARANRRVYEVEAIRSRRFNESKLQYEYLIKWLGWPESENTWESCSNTRCPELIQQYHIDDEEFLQTQIDDAMEMCSTDDPVIRFHRDGLCDLTHPSLTISKEEAQAAEEWITKLFNAQLKSISLRDQLDVLEERGFVNFKMRQRGRYDLTIDPKQLPFMENPPWLNTVKKILGGKAFLKHSGCMMSMPDSETQSWHSDGDHRDESTHLPCWMLNVFVPLIDMTRALGGTEFCPGSHVLHDEFIRTTPVTPLLKMGQVLLFDYRIRHRGMGNRATTARPVLYFSYAGNENIIDEKNFQKGRYLTLPPPLPSAELTREQRHQERMKRITKQELEENEGEEEEEEEEEKKESKEEAQQVNLDVEMQDVESYCLGDERKECGAAAVDSPNFKSTALHPSRSASSKTGNRRHSRA